MMRSLYVYLGLGAAVVGLGLYAWGLSGRLDHERERREFAEGWASSYADQLAIERDELHRVNQLLEDLQNKEVEIVYVDKIVTKEVIKYRDRIVNRCQLVSDWVCIANSAAYGVPADCGASQIQSRNP